MAKKAELNKYNIMDLEAGTVEIPKKNKGIFAGIRTQLLKLVQPGEAVLAAEVFSLIPELGELSGPNRYTYLKNALKGTHAFELQKFEDRLFIVRKG